MREQARRALASLTAPVRAAVALHHGLGLGVAETAGILGVPEGTVKSRCAAGRQLLRLRLDRPLKEVLEMAEDAVRLATREEMAAMNREWADAGGPAPRAVSEEELQARFADIPWPEPGAIGLPFVAGSLLTSADGALAWAFYGDGRREVMISFSALAPAEAWHTTVGDDSGAAVRVQTRIGDRPATWVTRPDGGHYVVFALGPTEVCLAGDDAQALRAMAETMAERWGLPNGLDAPG